MPETQEPVVLTPAQPKLDAVTGVPMMLRTRTELWLETAAVLIVAVLPDVLRSVWYVYWKSEFYESYARMRDFASLDAFGQASPYIHVLLRSLQVVPVVLYLTWRSGEPWREFGLTRPRWVSDVLLGLAIWLVGYLVYYVCFLSYGIVAMLLSRVANLDASVAAAQDLGKMYPAPRGWIALLVVIVTSCANGFAEELVMRAYLISRFERLLGSTWLGLFLTTGLFASYHAYQGLVGVLGATILGIVYGAAFCWLRRLWPLADAHALAGIVGTVWTSS